MGGFRHGTALGKADVDDRSLKDVISGAKIRADGLDRCLEQSEDTGFVTTHFGLPGGP